MFNRFRWFTLFLPLLILAGCTDPAGVQEEFPVALDGVIFEAPCPDFQGGTATGCVDEESWVGDGSGRSLREVMEDTFNDMFLTGAGNHARCQDLYDWGLTFIWEMAAWAAILESGGSSSYGYTEQNRQGGTLISWTGALKWTGDTLWDFQSYASTSMHEGMHLLTGVGDNDAHHDDFDEWVNFCYWGGTGTAPTWYW